MRKLKACACTTCIIPHIHTHTRLSPTQHTQCIRRVGAHWHSCSAMPFPLATSGCPSPHISAMSIPLCRKRTRRTPWPSPPWFHVCLLYKVLEFCLTVHCIGQGCRATLQRWPAFSIINTWCLQHRDSWLSVLTAVQRWPLYYSGACSTGTL